MIKSIFLLILFSSLAHADARSQRLKLRDQVRLELWYEGIESSKMRKKDERSEFPNVEIQIHQDMQKLLEP